MAAYLITHPPTFSTHPPPPAPSPPTEMSQLKWIFCPCRPRNAIFTKTFQNPYIQNQTNIQLLPTSKFHSSRKFSWATKNPLHNAIRNDFRTLISFHAPPVCLPCKREGVQKDYLPSSRIHHKFTNIKSNRIGKRKNDQIESNRNTEDESDQNSKRR